MESTSLKIDKHTKNLVRILGIPYSRIFTRGLVSLALDSKALDKETILMIKTLQNKVILDLEVERALLDDLIKHLDRLETIDNQEINEVPLPETNGIESDEERFKQAFVGVDVDYIISDDNHFIHMARRCGINRDRAIQLVKEVNGCGNNE